MTMKRNQLMVCLIGILSLLLTASCVREETRDTDLLSVGPDIKATQEGGWTTKTVLTTDTDGAGTIFWLPGERINVFFGRQSALYSSINDGNATTAYFRTEEMVEHSTTQVNNIWGLYPFDSTAECDGTSVTTIIPNTQKALAGTFDTNLFPLLAHSTDTDLMFYNVCGGIKFSLSRDDIYKITFRGNAGEGLLGKVKLSMSSGGRPEAQLLEEEKTIVLTPKTGSTFKKNENYYLICLPVSLSQGFEITFYSVNGKKASYRRDESLTIKRAVFARKTHIDQEAAVWEDNPEMTGGKRSGLYLGITGFNQELYNYPISRLNEVSINDFYAFINSLPMKNGTLLCYGADKSISRLEDAVFPDDLCAVALVTFTDGLDQGSVMMNPAYTSDETYLDAIHGRIRNERVADHSIMAYSVGMKGSDVSDENKFRSNLQKLASSSNNAFEVNDMLEVNSRLQEIAKKVTDISYLYDISMRIPGQSDGTRVRFTFDSVNDADASAAYIEGTFRLSDYSLHNVTYKGLSSDSGPIVKGAVDGIFVTFSFSTVKRDTGERISQSSIKQWAYISSTGKWQINSEFDSSQNIDVEVTKQSVAVMLVLDCSSSLGSQFSTMQQHARSFIYSLQQASYDPYAVSSVSLNTSSKTVKIGDSFTLTARITPSTARDKSVTWLSSNPSVAKVDQEGTVNAIAPGNAIILVTTSDGGYTATCSVEVKPVYVSRITLNKTSITLNEGESDILVVTAISPENATDKTVTWTSSNESVATVNSEGKVTAVSKGSATIRATANDGSGKYASCSITVNRIYVSSIVIDKQSLNLLEGEYYTLSLTITPNNAIDKTVTWSSSDETVATVDNIGKVTAISKGTATISATANDGSGKYASCSVIVFMSINGHGFVDLGLPSGLKWATCNVGATVPEEYGDYFAWGETQPYYSSQDPLTWKAGKTGYGWASYKFELGTGYNGPFSKYVPKSSYGTVDNKTVLDPEDDAARANWGGSWRMPTDENWTELRTECTWTWTFRNGVKGRLVTSPNGNSIFLPAAGYRYNTDLYNTGSSGDYWSSSLYTGSPGYAWYVNFYSDDVNRGYDSRYSGQSVRPVTE